jgi:hypothetical protein
MPRAEDIEILSKVPDDEPVFILRAQDVLAVGCISSWITRGLMEGVNRDKIKQVNQRLRDFLDFDPVKIPD